MARVNQVVGRGAYYKHGQILQNQILQIYDENPNFTLSEIAEGQTNLGDWYLLFGKYKLAMTAYEKSYEIVAMDQQSKKNLDKIYSQPLMLPKRTRYSYAEKNEVLTSIKAQDKSHLSNTTNYVNLTVDITDGGNPVNFDVKEIYPPEMDSFGTRAIETIRMKKFRPQLIKGSPVLSVKYPIRVIIPNE
jgi:tetratricopeptide (TPR) repeat protein